MACFVVDKLKAGDCVWYQLTVGGLLLRLNGHRGVHPQNSVGYIRQRVFYSTFSRRQTRWRQVRETTWRCISLGTDVHSAGLTSRWFFVYLYLKLGPNKLVPVDWIIDFNFLRFFLFLQLFTFLIFFSRIVHPCHTVLISPLPHCPPLPHRADMSTPAFSTPPFLTVPFCPLPQIPSTPIIMSTMWFLREPQSNSTVRETQDHVAHKNTPTVLFR